MRFDELTKSRDVLALGPVVATADANGVIDNAAGGIVSHSLNVSFLVGVGGITFTTTNRIDLKIEHSADGVTYEPVVSADLVRRITAAGDLVAPTVGAGGIVQSIVAAHPAAQHYTFGYVGGRRFVRGAFGFGGTHATGTPVALFGHQYRHTINPVPV